MTTEIPVFVESDPDAIMAEYKASLEALLGREILPAQFEQLLLQAVAYREVLLVNRFNSGMAQLLCQFSTAPILDYIAALVALERLPAAFAHCTVRFTLVEGHDNVIIPAGTRVATANRVIYVTNATATIAPGVPAVDLAVTAQIPGADGNGHEAGAINTMLDPLAFVASVANTDTAAGGSDIETDEQLRERIKLAPSQFSSAGSRQSYLFYAKSANTQIIDVTVTSPIPGTVLIVPLTSSDETPVKVIEDVYAVCNEEKVRPLTDTVIVAAPTRMDYAIVVDLELYEGADAVAVQKQISDDLEAYTKGKAVTLGQDIIRSHIAQKCRIPEVYDVVVSAPAENIIVSDSECPMCTGITVNITGFNRG